VSYAKDTCEAVGPPPSALVVSEAGRPATHAVVFAVVGVRTVVDPPEGRDTSIWRTKLKPYASSYV
jgi:hypothetical protein